MKTIEEFCKERGITREWLESRNGYLYLRGTQIASLPDGLTVGGDLVLIQVHKLNLWVFVLHSTAYQTSLDKVYL